MQQNILQEDGFSRPLSLIHRDLFDSMGFIPDPHAELLIRAMGLSVNLPGQGPNEDAVARPGEEKPYPEQGEAAVAERDGYAYR